MRTCDSIRPHLERRASTDRRATPTPGLRIRTPHRRSGFRRRDESDKKYVDQLNPKAFAWAITIVTLSTIDAVLTLIHIHNGGDELVPTMRWALSVSQEMFLGIKLTVTSIGAVYLAAHYNFAVGRFCIRFVFVVYFCLMLYHAHILWMRI